MKSFIGKSIKVGGRESKNGTLMDANDDLLVLLTEDNEVVYYHTQHIKSFTGNTKGQTESSLELPEDLEYIKADNFQNLLESLKNKIVKINGGGPEKLEGVLAGVSNGFVILVNNKDMVSLSKDHIKSISYGLTIDRSKDEKSDK